MGIWEYSYTTPATVGNAVEHITATINGELADLQREYFVASFDVPGPFKGTGTHEVTFTVTHTAATVLENALVTLKEGVNQFTWETDDDGEVVFNLNPATYRVTIWKDGYTFAAVNYTVTVDSATHAHTFEMSQQVISPSANPDLTTPTWPSGIRRGRRCRTRT